MRGIPEIMVCRILMFLWPFGALTRVRKSAAMDPFWEKEHRATPRQKDLHMQADRLRHRQNPRERRTHKLQTLLKP